MHVRVMSQQGQLQICSDMVNCSDDNSGSTTKSLGTKLLMGTVKRDI
jgi:hypothetical protein